MEADELGLSFTFVPAIVCALIAFVLASFFLSLFESSIDTILLCFLEDSEVNDGTAQKPYYMSQALMNLTKVVNVKMVESKVKRSSVQPAPVKTASGGDEF
jgi:choline transporter-like protein 2/4/5